MSNIQKTILTIGIIFYIIFLGILYSLYSSSNISIPFGFFNGDNITYVCQDIYDNSLCKVKDLMSNQTSLITVQQLQSLGAQASIINSAAQVTLSSPTKWIGNLFIGSIIFIVIFGSTLFIWRKDEATVESDD
jgi:hypothetical protein